MTEMFGCFPREFLQRWPCKKVPDAEEFEFVRSFKQVGSLRVHFHAMVYRLLKGIFQVLFQTPCTMGTPPDRSVLDSQMFVRKTPPQEQAFVHASEAPRFLNLSLNKSLLVNPERLCWWHVGGPCVKALHVRMLLLHIGSCFPWQSNSKKHSAVTYKLKYPRPRNVA